MSATSRTADGGAPLALPSDANNLSEYHCLLREQIVLIAATSVDIEGSAQGRLFWVKWAFAVVTVVTRILLAGLAGEAIFPPRSPVSIKRLRT